MRTRARTHTVSISISVRSKMTSSLPGSIRSPQIRRRGIRAPRSAGTFTLTTLDGQERSRWRQFSDFRHELLDVWLLAPTTDNIELSNLRSVTTCLRLSLGLFHYSILLLPCALYPPSVHHVLLTGSSSNVNL